MSAAADTDRVVALDRQGMADHDPKYGPINDNPIYQQLGLPISTPHFWEEGFDFSALAG